jgi:GNAT superfamily N-acetyltransferase
VITLLDETHLRALCDHLSRHGAESGRDGDVIFRPRSADDPLDEELTISRHRTGWSKPLTEALWLRTWAVVDDGVIHGHLDLHGGRLPTELHRATLGMGVERGSRGKGHGRALLELAMKWSRNAELVWLDLGVFAHNARARTLYHSVGFVEVGLVRDQFRVEGVQIDDVAMVLKL